MAFCPHTRQTKGGIMTAGEMVFYAGEALIAVSVLLWAALLLTGPHSRRRIEKRLEEKY